MTTSSIFTVKPGDKLATLGVGVTDQGVPILSKFDISAAKIKTLSFLGSTYDAGQRGNLYARLGEMYGFTTQDIQDEIADLARVDYDNYIVLKQSFRDNISYEVRKNLVEGMTRFKMIGYSDEQALEMAKPAADALLTQLKARFHTMFPKTGILKQEIKTL